MVTGSHGITIRYGFKQDYCNVSGASAGGVIVDAGKRSVLDTFNAVVSFVDEVIKFLRLPNVMAAIVHIAGFLQKLFFAV